jgi:hypothetical protein
VLRRRFDLYCIYLYRQSRTLYTASANAGTIPSCSDGKSRATLKAVQGPAGWGHIAMCSPLHARGQRAHCNVKPAARPRAEGALQCAVRCAPADRLRTCWAHCNVWFPRDSRGALHCPYGKYAGTMLYAYWVCSKITLLVRYNIVPILHRKFSRAL